MRLFLRLVLCVAVLSVSNVARATPSRVIALGNMAEYVDDDTNVGMYPSLIAKYAHFAYVDLGGGNQGAIPALNEIQIGGGANGAAFVRLGDFQLGVMSSDFVPTEEATFLNQAASARANTMYDMGNAASISALANLGPLRRYDLILGFGSPKDFAAGLRFSFGGFNQTYNAPVCSPTSTTACPNINDPTLMDPTKGPTRTSDSQSLGQFRLQGGVTVNFGGGSSLDAALDYTNFSASYLKNQESTFNGGGGNAIGLNARLRLPITRFWTLIPQIQWRSWFFGMQENWTIPGFGPTDNTRSIPLDNNNGTNREALTHSMSQTYVDFGLAGELKAAKNATFWLAAGVLVASFGSDDTDIVANDSNLKLNTETATSALLWSLPYIKFGAEYRPFDFLSVRFGAEKYAFQASTTSTNTNNDSGMNQNSTQVITQGASASVPNALLSQADFNIFSGLSFIIPQGFALDMLLLNQIYTGNFKAGWGGRASISYKF